MLRFVAKRSAEGAVATSEGNPRQVRGALRIARHAEPVISILKIRRNAGPRRAARNFHMMPPRPPARSFALPLLRTARIALRRNYIVTGIVPIVAPFVNVVAKVVNAKSVRSILRHDFRTVLPAPRIIRKSLRRIVAPGKLPLLQISTSRSLPFRFTGKPVDFSSL